jgi:hypothetical protein
MQASGAWNKLPQKAALLKLSAIARHNSSARTGRADELAGAVVFQS